MAKTNWKGDEPWKRREPGNRFGHSTEKTNINKNMREALKMAESVAQEVKVIFEKKKLWQMDHYHSFIVTMKIPLRKDEVLKRMQDAFPKLELIEEGL